jgi:hypothetical protein
MTAEPRWLHADLEAILAHVVSLLNEFFAIRKDYNT